MLTCVTGVADRLEKKFSNIRKRFLAELNKNSDLSPDDLVDSLTLLPIALRAEYQKFISENLHAIEKEDSIRKIFRHINPLLSFIDYNLLEFLINEYGSEQLQKEMVTYANKVNTFLRQTTIEQLTDYWPGHQDIPPHFDKLTAIINGDPSTFTLQEVNTLRRKFCCETSLTETVLVLIGVRKTNSFLITWIVPSMYVPRLKSMIGFLRSLKTFYQKERVMSVTLGGQLLYSIAVRSLLILYNITTKILHYTQVCRAEIIH